MQNQEIEKANIIIKAFEEENVRMYLDNEKNELWFCGKDVCSILGFANHIRKLSQLDDDEKGGIIFSTPSGMQKMTFINESGLYCLIFKSKLREAKQFRKWITSEVLPSIRKTGKYEMPKIKDEKYNEELQILQLTKLEKAKQLLQTNGQLCERDEIMIKDQTRNIVFNNNQPKLLENPEIAISSRLTDHHKIKLTQKINKDLKNFGTIIKAEYLKRHNNPPIKRQQYVDGATRLVNCYYQSDYIEFIDEMIKERYSK